MTPSAHYAVNISPPYLFCPSLLSERGVSRASVPACDQRERADNGAIATPYRARATRGSVGGSERTSGASVRARESEANGKRCRGEAEVERERAWRKPCERSERGGSRASGVNAVSGYVTFKVSTLLFIVLVSRTLLGLG